MRGLFIIPVVLLTALMACMASFAATPAEEKSKSTIDEWFDDEGLAWLKGLTFGADVRLRYDGEWEDIEANGEYRKNDRSRGRFRLRFGFEKNLVNQELRLAFRLASGTTSAAASRDETFDNNFSEKSLWIDLAYVEYTPKWFPSLTVLGGKIKNPFLHTNILWDADVSMEGLVENYRTGPGCPEISLSSGQFFLVENKWDTEHDVTLLALQGSGKCEFASFWFTFSLAGYIFEEYEEYFTAAHGNPTTTIDGKTILSARDFRVADLLGAIGTSIRDVPVVLTLDYAKNNGDADTTWYRGKNEAVSAILNVGKCEAMHDWEFRYQYAYVEPNAVPGDFADPDIRANRKGHITSFRYQVFKSATLSLAGYLTQPAFGPRDHRYKVQADFLVWF